ncbi:MAG TPA: peptidoglycan editing factor PgeF [Anaerolineae bacterium]|nr:peptidoglycan editing factor PgeF [Anaerolineae bacterium]
MQRVQAEGLTWYTFSDAPSAPFRHALVTRLGGVSRGPLAALNLGSSVGDDPVAVAENHRLLFAALDLPRERVVSPHQVHGRRVARVGREDGGAIIPDTDALITNTPGTALLLRFADCAPVLLYDPVHRAAGLAHAGWRGAAGGVVAATLNAMYEVFGSRPGDMWAGIGPAIGPDHYIVGSEVVAAIAATLPGDIGVAVLREGQWYLDLPGALAAQLTALGVSRVTRAGVCTACHTEEWYSHRQERGRTGRFGALVMLD